jgi:hypothetical protein
MPDSETTATCLKNRYSANSQANSDISNECRAREDDPEPVATICVGLCIGFCVVLRVTVAVALPVLLSTVPMLVTVVVTGVVVAEILAITDDHVGPSPYVEQTPSNPCELNDDA